MINIIVACVFFIFGMFSYGLWEHIKVECMRDIPETKGENLTTFQKLMLNWIFSEALVAGNQQDNLAMIHKMLFTTSRRIYPEDNNITHVNFTTEFYQRALDECSMGIGIKLVDGNNQIEVYRT